MKQTLQAAFTFPAILVEGYRHITVSVFSFLRTLAASHPFTIVWFGLVGTGIVFTSAPWIQYTTEFAETEVNRITSNAWPAFASLGFLSALVFFIPFRIRGLLYWILSLLIFALWIYGYFNPQEVHTAISDPADFSYYFWIYVYAVVQAAALIVSFKVFSSNPAGYGRIHTILSGSAS